jgi:dUTP pyrophosphatase
MKFTKVRDVKSPEIAHVGDAGIDFFVPKLTKELILEIQKKSLPCHTYYNEQNKSIIIWAGQRVLIPSGIHVKLQKGMALIAHNKSGIANRLGLDKMAEVVDEPYQGEVHISLANNSSESVEITEGMKIIQFLRIPVFSYPIEEVPTLEELYTEKSSRGRGGFGSTGI